MSIYLAKDISLLDPERVHASRVYALKTMESSKIILIWWTRWFAEKNKYIEFEKLLMTLQFHKYCLP